MKRATAALLLAVLLDLLGFGMLIIDFQFRAKAFGAAGWMVGLLLASTFLTQVLVSPRWGSFSDRIGRKPVILICTILSGLAMLFYALATNLWWLLASRLLAGFGAANVAVAQAFVSDTSSSETRTAAMGRMGAAISTGLILGPIIGSALTTAHRSEWIGYVAAGFSFAGVILVAVAIPHTKPQEQVAPRRRPTLDFSLLAELPLLRPLVLVAVVAWFSLATLEGTFGQLIQKTLGFDQVQFGIVFSYESLLSVVVQGVLLAWISRKFSDGPLLRAAYILQGIGLAITPFAPGFAILMVASTLYALGAGVANPTINSLASKLTPEERQGELFGLLQGARSLGFIVGPIVGGALFDWYYAAPYVVAGLVCLCAAMIIRVPQSKTLEDPLTPKVPHANTL